MNTWPPTPEAPASEPEPEPGPGRDAWWSTPAEPRGTAELDLDAEPPLPTMAQLDQLSAELDEIDAALVLMDAEGPLARPAPAAPAAPTLNR